MDTLLFSGRSVWTMVHGIVFGGGALLGLSAALYTLVTVREVDPTAPHRRSLGWLLVVVAVMLWLTVILGTYVSFPAYRATPPEGVTDLAAYPRSLIQSRPGTVWLHSFAMEIKEHVPWVAAMLATAVAFVGMRVPTRILADAPTRRLATSMLAICFALVSVVSLLGVFINKAAPLE
jgi:hypothetical protein